MSSQKPGAGQKALQINLDARRYGTFAEIGAGQEVARWFFRVGGAAGTVAKTISAYDMAVSDAIYGSAERYVSRQRLQAMLAYEFDLLLQRLDKTRGDKSTFFAFANTVATHSFSHQEEGHGWLGIRFQAGLREPPSEILIHVRMLDKENFRQQEALGIIGVNLIHGAFYLCRAPEALISALLDSLTWERVEVDMIRFAGPAFSEVDNRLMALLLVKQGLTEAAMFTAEGEAAQWNEVLYKKPVLIQRGNFRPITNATLDVLDRALEQFIRASDLAGEQPVVLLEMNLRQMSDGDAIDHRDFLDRADTLTPLGKLVLVSNFRRYHRVAAYLSRYTKRPIGMAMGAGKLAEIFDPHYYNEAEGGLLGGLGQLFKNPGRLYIYPFLDFHTGRILTVKNYPIAPSLKHLYAHLCENRFIQDIRDYNPDCLRIRSGDVLKQIRAGEPAWEQSVPPRIVQVIRANKLFGHP